MLRIVTDGAVDMPAGWEKEYDIQVLPLSVRFGERTFMQGVDINADRFYELVQANHIIPKTSLPSPQQVADFYRKIARKGDEILSIHVASKLSGTFSTIQIAARELVGELNIFPFDSGAGSAAQGYMCREARLRARRGESLQDILNRLASLREQLTLVFTVDNLEFARLSGRVNSLQSTLSSMLRIKPIILLREGLLIASEKVRTRQRALDRILDYAFERVGGRKITLAVVHAADPETAQLMVEKARRIFNIKELIITELSIPVAAHMGPGTIGIVAIPEEV